MRAARWMVGVIAVLAGCATDPGAEVLPATVLWMEWPAAVPAGEPFMVRLVGFGGECREVVRLDAAPRVDQIAATFEPQLVVSRRQLPCPLPGAGLSARAAIPVPSHFDTVVTVPPLAPAASRSYEMRAATLPFPTALGAPERMVRTFGDVMVRRDSVAAGVTRIGGQVFATQDSLGCVRFVVLGLSQRYVVENLPVARSLQGLVRGYVYSPAAPVCGETRVLHVESFE